MAKKYRKNHRKTVKTERVQTAESSSQLSVLLGMAGRELGMDGYSNAAAFLGDDSPLLSAGTFARNTLTSNPELLTTMYRVNWLCKRIIDMPTEDMTKAWYKLSTSVSEEELHDSDADPGLWDCFDYYAAGDGFYCGVECGDCATDGCQRCNRGFSGYGNL